MLSRLLVLVLFLPLMWGQSDSKIHRVTFIGNSLTQAGPMPGYGWAGYWGVAASQADKDYLHRVQLGITARQGSIVEVSIISADIPTMPTDVYTKVVSFGADLIIVEMGDNAAWETTDTTWLNTYGTIRAAAPHARIIATGLWHPLPSDIREEAIKIVAKAFNMEFVPLSDLDTTSNQVQSEGRCTNDSVCWHPGDAGMQAIADRLLGAICE